MQMHHIPVLLEQSIENLITDKSGVYFDGTVGFGGHSNAILSALNKDALLIGTDVDSNAFKYAKLNLSNDRRFKLYNFNFSEIEAIAKIESINCFNGIFADLGVSSFQLDNKDSGFSYRMNADLDLRMNKNISITAADVVNTFEESRLADILFKFGEEKNSKKIAALICKKRKNNKIMTTLDLKNIISEITPERYIIKTLSRVFQALRIFINNELVVLQSFLEKSVSLLCQGGRICILTYHSLEDRIVKDFFKYETLNCVCPKDFPVCKCGKIPRLKIITKKPIIPDSDEIKLNFRARSAKLRVAERI